MGAMVSFPADGGSTGGYQAEPAEKATRGVVVIQEWWGLDAHVRDVADRFAARGFFALAPDLYHGKLTRSPDEAGKLLMAMDIPRAERDLRGAVQHVQGATGRPVGTVGFCMGGALSLFAACTNPEGVGACVVYYGGHPKVSFDFDRLKAPVLGHWAEDDPSANAVQKRVAEELSRRAKPHTFHTYVGTRHAFFNDTRPEVFAREAALLSFARTVEFFEKHL
jgi:carboxymethylenebutenolidase